MSTFDQGSSRNLAAPAKRPTGSIDLSVLPPTFVAPKPEAA
jgi:hypothetical protein